MLMVVEISAATSLAIAGPKKFLLQHRILADDYIVTNIYTYLLKKIQKLKEEEKKTWWRRKTLIDKMADFHSMTANHCCKNKFIL